MDSGRMTLSCVVTGVIVPVDGGRAVLGKDPEETGS